MGEKLLEFITMIVTLFLSVFVIYMLISLIFAIFNF